MSESNSPDPLSLHEKGPVYSKLISKVFDTSEGGLETIIYEDMLARGWLFTDADRIFKRIKEDVFPAVSQDPAYQNAVANTPEKARLELTAAVKKAMGPMLKDDTEFYKQFVQNESFKQFVVTFVDQLLSDDRKAG